MLTLHTKTDKNMKKTAPLATVIAILLAVACSSRDGKSQQADNIEIPTFITGDSVVFGLACDGCTDTILVVLRNIYGNPDTFNILEATRSHQIFGMPRIGDRIALLTDSDSTVARMAIDIDQLRGQWCFLATPTLRKRAGITEQMRQQFLQQMPDSVRDSLFAPREMGFMLKGDGTARSIGWRFEADEGPAEYPQVKHYGQWRLHNGRLILTEMGLDSLGNRTILDHDTASLVMLRRDTLVLRFNNEEKGYYRKEITED